MTRGKLIASLAIVATAGALAVPTAAAAGAGNWSSVTNLPTVTSPTQVHAYANPVGGAMYFYVKDAIPTLSRVSAEGNLEGTQAVPNVTAESTHSGIPEQIAFRPDGSSIVAWKVQGAGHAYMAFRAESGGFGKPVQIDQNFRTVAIAGSEVMVLAADGTVVSQQSYTLGAKGALTSAGAPNNIYVGGADQVYATMTAAGPVDVIIQGVPNSQTTTQIIDVNRDATGDWSSGVALSNTSNNVTDSSFATNPSGRAAVTWTESAGAQQFAYVRFSIRQPQAAFAPAAEVTNSNSVHGAKALSLTAVGDDGTVAIAPSVITYSSADDFTVANSVYLIQPADSAPGTGVPIDIFEGPQTRFAALGANDGKAVVGYLVDDTSAGDPTYPDSYNVFRYAGATIVGADGTTSPKGFGAVTGYYDPSFPGDGCPATECLGTTPPDESVLGTTIDTHGQVTVLGQITPHATDDPVGYVSRFRYGQKPHLTLTSKALTATKKTVSVPLSCAKKDCFGKITLTTNITVKHKHKKATHKTISVTKSAVYIVETGSAMTVKVPLSKAGLKALKAAKGHTIHAALGITVTKGAKNLAKKVTVTK